MGQDANAAVNLDPVELLLTATIVRGLEDAQQTEDMALRYEAIQWLWMVAPLIAEKAGLPRIAEHSPA